MAGDLASAELEVDPPHAFRYLHVRRADGAIVANQSWDQSRSRGIRIWPASTFIDQGETLLLQAVAWWETPVELTAILTWKAPQ